MQCHSCGTQLTTGMAYCPACGAMTAFKVPASEGSPSDLTEKSPSTAGPMQAPPSTLYGSSANEMLQSNPYPSFDPYHAPPPPSAIHRPGPLSLGALIIGAIVLVVLASTITYSIAFFSPNQFHVQATATAFAALPTSSPIPFMYTSEAESSTNTLIGSAEVAACSRCSGSQKVGFVGNDTGALQFNAIEVSSADTYLVTIYYCSAETRDAYMSVDGGAGRQLIFSSTGDWATPGPLAVSVKLSMGNHSVKFYNPTGWAPDFDRITITNDARSFS